ncbi:MAG TPA: hypothetical protein PKV29_00790, partial [Trichococcus flocculiformis]|nr:hypothetical protein [Trichococcus flocculiformis]
PVSGVVFVKADQEIFMSNQETVVSALERRIDMSVPLADIEKDVEARYQFVVKDHRLTFHGICRDCQQKMRNK